MPPTTETGFASTVANFEQLIQICTSYGNAYNPSKNSIKIDALIAKHTEAKNAISQLNNLIPANIIAINNRIETFSPLNKLVTRILNSAASSEININFIKDIKTITRKLQGKRAKPIKQTIPIENEEPPQTHSVSQMSFDNRIKNFQQLIELLASEPAYSPNEPELTVASLTTLLNNMKTTNQAVLETDLPVKNARINRNNILYNPQTGLITVANDVKKYIKSLFGAASPQFKYVSKLIFVKRYR